MDENIDMNIVGLIGLLYVLRVGICNKYIFIQKKYKYCIVLANSRTGEEGGSAVD
jgi:hypothetical protein